MSDNSPSVSLGVERSILLARNRLQGHFSKYFLSWFTQDDTPSDTPVTLMVPVAPKDIGRARRSIPEMVRHLAHPIDRVVVVAPNSSDVQQLCLDLNIDFVDERQPLEALLGADRYDRLNSWYRQQLLKLTSPDFLDADHVVSIDSDTYPLRPTSFITPDGRAILQLMPRDLENYHSFTERMIGPTPHSRKSFISHCMVFQRTAVNHLFKTIETYRGAPWHETLLKTLQEHLGVFSEFDMLGHCLVRDRRETIFIRNCANLKVSDAQFLGEEPLPAIHRRFRFVSNHQRGA